MPASGDSQVRIRKERATPIASLRGARSYHHRRSFPCPCADKINAGSEPSSQVPTKPPRQKKNDALYKKLLSGKLDHLTLEYTQQIEPVLQKYAHVFHDEDTNDFKGTNFVGHQIPTDDVQPTRRPKYLTPYAVRHEMQREDQDMLDEDIIRESKSPRSAPAILVPKKSVDGRPKHRFCVDFRAFNAVTKFDP